MIRIVDGRARRAAMAGLALLTAALSLPAAAPSARAEGEAGHAFAAMRAVFYHELGHGLIDVLDLPVVGPEEDVVDEFSTIVLILTGAGDRRQIEAVRSAARFWAEAAATGRETPAWDEHSPSDRRAFAIQCLLYGSDPEAHGDIVERTGMSGSRAQRCRMEFAEKQEKWMRILAPHLRAEAAAPGFEPAYAQAETKEVADIARLWEQTRFVEGLTAEASRYFALPAPMQVVAGECGMPNAFWNGEMIVLCYELQPWIEGLLAGAGASGGVRMSTGGGSTNIGSALGTTQ